jgi:hypothetical protein
MESVFDNSSFNAVFFSFLITSLVGCILKIISMMYKSKCKKVKFCCITIVRDVEAEVRADQASTTNEGSI